MIHWAIREAAVRQCALIQLTSDKTRVRAHRFYERLGFKATREGLQNDHLGRWHGPLTLAARCSWRVAVLPRRKEFP